MSVTKVLVFRLFLCQMTSTSLRALGGSFHVGAVEWTVMDVHCVSWTGWIFLIVCLATQDAVGALQITAIDIYSRVTGDSLSILHGKKI